MPGLPCPGIIMNISPAIRRLYPSLDPEQLAVTGHGDGPLLTLAGPGSGKTACICLRAVNLLLAGRGGAPAPAALYLHPGHRP